MLESSGQCEDDSCTSYQSSSVPTRVFPCLYHCKKMLCIQHLSEHDEYLEKQIHYRRQLEDLWKDYILIFDEEKLQREAQRLKAKLDDHHRLNKHVQNLLTIDPSDNPKENDQQIQLAIQTVQGAIRQDGNLQPKIESTENEQAVQNFESETIDSAPSISNTNGTSPADKYLSDIDQFGSDNEDETMDNSREENKSTNNVTPNRVLVASKLRGSCPLTEDGVFGINSHIHGISLCPKTSPTKQRICRLHLHFRRVHHLTSLASLALARAVGSGQDPWTTRLFNDDHIILNIDELRTVTCPITKHFRHHPLLSIENAPCHTIKQVRHLKEHLKRVHKFTNRAATIIIKAVQTDIPVCTLQFPQAMDIVEDENPF